jgi:hypothetical protein
MERFWKCRLHGSYAPPGLLRGIVELGAIEGFANFFENLLAPGDAEK